MYLLEQLKKSFISFLFSELGEGEARIPTSQENNDETQPDALPYFGSRILQDLSSISESEDLDEFIEKFNERLNSIDLEERFVTTQLTILLNGLRPIAEGAFPGYGPEDEGYQSIRTTIDALDEILKNLQSEGNQLNVMIQARLQEHLGSINENIGDFGNIQVEINNKTDTEGNINDTQVNLSEQQILDNEQKEKLVSQRQSLAGVIRESIGDVNFERENFERYSTEAQIIIKLAIELSSRDRVLDSESIDRITLDIIQLQDVQRDLSIVLNNESVPGSETLSEKAGNEIERAFLDLKENGTEIQKEIIGEKSYIDMRKGDFLRLWLEGDVDLGKIFLQSKIDGIGESGVRDTYTINFGGNPEISKLLSAIIPLSVEKILVDGRTANRTGEREFRLEGGLPLSVQDGSEITIQENNVDMTPEEVDTRIESYRESMASNANREEFERRVNSEIERREMNGEEADGGWLATMFKKIMNALAQAVGEDPIFEEVLEREQELLTGYSDADMDRIQRDGMRRFSPDGQEVLRDTEFMNGMNAMCGRLGVQRDDMLIVMQAESGLNPQAINPTSRASGLIQFMPRTAEGLGTTVSAIQKMSAVEQLVYVEKYFENYAGRMNSVADIYRVVFYPASIGKPADWVLGSQNGTANIVARQNGPGITRHSQRSDGLIDNATFDRYVAAKVSQFSTISYSTAQNPGSVRNEGIGEITRGIHSRSMERSESGTTLCSKTARLNLSDLGVNQPHRGSSARASFDEYNGNEISSFPPSDTDATVADLYLDASSGNERYGHRAACFKQDGQWYVLDPYYRMGRSESQRNNPILAEDYMNYMQNNLGRRVWGAAYFK